MGTMRAIGMAESVREGHATLETALRYHLTVNHFPAVSEVWVGPCIEAIEAANEDDFDRLITGPWGSNLTAFELIEGLHLEAFIGLEVE